ncbi:MAG: lasso peptide biosynthesis B2 protein [Butyrivibrio sp.]|nr:lasso peptide biosynthesis B2 protein [Butyrivibrio sp.]
MKFSIKNFIFKNQFKKLTILSYIYSAYYRFQIKFIKPSKLKKNWGEEGKESQNEETKENYLYAAHVAQNVGRICNKTAWESKCLVRALTARKLLNSRNIHSTMYLGVNYADSQMKAHAWVRVGRMIVTGGDVYKDYTVVDKFYS